MGAALSMMMRAVMGVVVSVVMRGGYPLMSTSPLPWLGRLGAA